MTVNTCHKYFCRSFNIQQSSVRISVEYFFNTEEKFIMWSKCRTLLNIYSFKWKINMKNVCDELKTLLWQNKYY